MPASESCDKRRTSSPKPEASYRGPNTALAESGGRKQSRKKGKNAPQKETNTTNDAEVAVLSELRESAVPARPETANGSSARRSPTRDDSFPSSVWGALNAAGDVSDSDGPKSVGSWTQSVPFSKRQARGYQESMSVGASPPGLSIAIERGGFSSKTPPSSPPMRKSRPASYSAGTYFQQARQLISDKPVRVPLQPFGASVPPLPHLPQAHFYGLPDVDLGYGNRVREASSERTASFLSFADVPSPNLSRQRHRPDGVLLAFDDRLDILALEKGKMAALGALEAVGGTIVDAKVLSWESDFDPFDVIRPLVSLVVHGPRRRNHAPFLAPEEDRNPPTTATGLFTPWTGGTTDFETTVEIYSLSTQEHLATLMCSQPTLGLPNMRGLPASAPPPVGSLKLDARGNFLTVSSGMSGEIFVFGADRDTTQFRCLGKFWTSVQTFHDRRYSNSSNSTDPDVSPADENRGGKFAALPIMSLSGRWLAIVPPGPTACQHLPIVVEPDSMPTNAPGLDSHNAPPRPPVSCAVESPDAEGFINRVARGVAQEVVRGARWLGGQGLQTWNNYWNQNSGAQTCTQNRNFYQSDSHLPAGIFPPTHAPEARPTSAEPQLVSIIDLQELARGVHGSNSDTVVPVATFQPPNGVSFLSFAPDGLSIVSATKKGDVQYVWDLKQCRHLRAAALLNSLDAETSIKSAKVTQLARFARLTPSSIVDIEWKGPSGDRFAVVTKNGTIHIFDLPLSAFQWPSLRRSVRRVPSSAPASPAVDAQPDEPTSVGGVFSSAMKLAGKTQPILSNLRGRAPSIGMSNAAGSGNNSIAFASATGIRGGKVVAAGLSRSVGAATGTVSSLRHAGDNRIHFNNLARFPARSRVCWSKQGEQASLMVIDGQLVKSFRVSKRRASPKPGRQSLSVIDTNPRLHLELPASERLAAIRGSSKPAQHSDIDANEELVNGYWTLPPSSKGLQPSRIVHPLSYAEIETNAPYQPFHSDRRVNLYVYDSKFGSSTTTDTHEPWTFGDEIVATRLDIRPPTDSDEEEQQGGASVLYRHTSMTSGEPVGSEEGTTGGQVVVTTRRRKNKPPHQSVLAPGVKAEANDGFFEDDCDVLDFAEDRV